MHSVFLSYRLHLHLQISLAQGCIWNDWSPVSAAVDPVLHWTPATIALLGNWGPICYLIAVIPTSYMMDVHGLRLATIAAGLLCFVGSGLRCFTTHNPEATILIHIGQFCNGLAGPVAMSAGPVLSSTWFPMNQRTTATAILVASNYLGFALSFVGPYFIPDTAAGNRTTLNAYVPPHLADSVTDVSVSTSTMLTTTTTLSPATYALRSHEILVYMWAQTAFCALLLICAVAYFPNKPPSSPTLSAGSDRTAFIKGAKQLLTHRTFWVIALGYGVMTGVYSGFFAFLSPNLAQFMSAAKSQSLSGWLGFWAQVAGSAGAIGISFAVDHMGGKMKRALLVMTLCATGSALWFCFICSHIAPSGTVYLYISIILNGLFVNSTIPLFYELAIEVTYPIAEGSTTGLLTTLNNVGCLVFLFVPDIPNVGNAWVNWTLMGACALAFLLVFCVTEHYERRTVDMVCRTHTCSTHPYRWYTYIHTSTLTHAYQHIHKGGTHAYQHIHNGGAHAYQHIHKGGTHAYQHTCKGGTHTYQHIHKGGTHAYQHTCKGGTHTY